MIGCIFFQKGNHLQEPYNLNRLICNMNPSCRRSACCQAGSRDTRPCPGRSAVTPHSGDSVPSLAPLPSGVSQTSTGDSVPMHIIRAGRAIRRPARPGGIGRTNEARGRHSDSFRRLRGPPVSPSIRLGYHTLMLCPGGPAFPVPTGGEATRRRAAATPAERVDALGESDSAAHRGCN